MSGAAPTYSRWTAWWHRWRWRRQQAASVRAVLRSNCGEGVLIDPSVQILGCANVRIGPQSILSEGCWLNVNERLPGVVNIRIGGHCFLGRRNFLSSGALIEIGDYCITGPDCHFLGANHLFDTPWVPYLASGVTTQDEIHVGVNCWLGAGVTVLKGLRVGYGSVLGAQAVVTRDVPPFSLVVGNPARVLKRFRPTTGAWAPAGEWTPEDEAQLPGEAAYLARLRAGWPHLEGPRLASGWRGGHL